MVKTAIVTDTTAFLDQDMIKTFNVYEVPLSVIFDGKAYREGIDMTAAAFYEKLETEQALPTTSQPPVGAFVSLFEQLKEEGYTDVISVHLSSKISGTYQTAMSAARMVEGLTVHGFDSEISSAPQAFFVQTAAEMVQDGADVTHIIATLQQLKERACAYFMVDDLNHLRRGGRLSGAQALIGGLLQIKPILHFEDGTIVPFEKVRTEKKALNRILSMLYADIDAGKVTRVAVIHANRPDRAEALKQEIEAYNKTLEIRTGYFSPVIGTHLGVGSLGIGWH